MKKIPRLITFLSILFCLHVRADSNLVPNPDFNDPQNPLEGWRTYFPWEDEWYAQNGKYVKPATEQGRTCALLDFPGSIASNQAGKIESAFLKIEPGATYDVELDCIPGNMFMKIFAELWTTDPNPSIKPDKYRVPAESTHPALVMCYRSQFTDPAGPPDRWITVKREVKVPKTVFILGKPQSPEYLTVKVVVYSTTDGKAYVTNYQVTKIR